MAVIAIIAILASLLLATLSQAKSAAYQAGCQSNLRQLGVALRLYVDDNAVFPTDASFTHTDWKDDLSKYLGPNLALDASGSILFCPKTGLPPKARTYGYNGLGFGPNQGLFGEFQGNGFIPVRESQVLVPVAMIALGDGFSKTTGGQVLAPSDLLLRIGLAVSASPESLRFWTQAAATRHKHRANIAFCDGHVELVPHRTLFLDDSDDALRRWNKDHQPHNENLSSQ